MPQVDWNTLLNGNGRKANPYSGCNVKMFNVVRKNEEKSKSAGRAIYDEIPSISFQWPGCDETVRAIEEKDKMEHPQLWAAFNVGVGEVQSGMPLKEWTRVTASAVHELAYLGFRTVEQLAQANDEVKRKLGPLSKFCKEAQEWLDAANSPQAQVVSLKEAFEREKLRADRLENQLELLMQRIEANEGTRLQRTTRPAIELSEIDETSPKRKKKVSEDA